MAFKSEMEVQWKCCLKQCHITNGDISENQDRVEVKTYVPTESAAAGVNFNATWGESGDAVLHKGCWNRMMKDEIPLSDLETSMLHEAEKTAEFHHGRTAMEKEARRIADMIVNAKFAIAFTGAGISTSAGIGDFRGKSGQWTENDRKKEYGSGAKKDKKKQFTYEELRPTYTHDALALLVDMGYIKHIISQNCDGLHRLSGIPTDRLWELHGNVFHERCEACGARYDRPTTVYGLPQHIGRNTHLKPCERCRHYHYTGRTCEKEGCTGYLMDTVINFSDFLETRVLGGAEEAARQNDMVLCLGTTLQVSPANSLVEAGNPIRLAICNRQPTPCDRLCSRRGGDGRQMGSRVFGDCDPLMRLVMGDILGVSERDAWEAGREARMKVYNQKRGR